MQLNSQSLTTTPYAWPYDEVADVSRLALVIVADQDAQFRGELAEALGAELIAGGGAVVRVTTTAPRHPADPGDHGDRFTAAGRNGFFGTNLDARLRAGGITHLLLAGAWLEAGVHSTLRAANDRGYECLLLADACVSADPGLQPAALSMIEMSGGIFGAVGSAQQILAALQEIKESK